MSSWTLQDCIHSTLASSYKTFYVSLRAIWFGLFLTSTTWSLCDHCFSNTVIVWPSVAATEPKSEVTSLMFNEWMNKSSSLARTDPCWMHMLSSEQSKIQYGSRARRVLQSVPAIRPPLETNDSDKLKVFDGKNCLHSFINLKQRAFLHHYSVLLLIRCWEPRVVWKTYCAGLWLAKIK